MFPKFQKIKSLLLSALLPIIAPAFVFAHFGARTPFGGSVSCAITYDNIVYLGTNEGGVFESVNDQVAAWRPRPVGLLSGKITALAHSGSYLFAATADDGVYIFNGFVGNDRYWVRINTGITDLSIKSLVAVDSITVLAGTNGSGLFKTTDKGVSWTAVNDVLINNKIVTTLVKAGSRIILTTASGGVFASDNGGDSWVDLNDINTMNISGTTVISYNETTDELMVLNSNGLFVATSASTTNTPAYLSAATNLPANTEVRAISNNGDHWYLATDNGVYTTTSGTINWAAVNTGFTSSDATAIVALSATIVTGIRKEGVYKSPVGSINWELTNTNFNNTVTHTMIATGEGLVITVTEDGVFVSTSMGSTDTYSRRNMGLTDSTNVNDIILAENILLAATVNGGVFSSPDTGKTWTAINSGLSNLNIIKLFYANQKVYAIDASGNLFTSELNAYDWQGLQSGLPNGVLPTSMAFYGNKILLGTMGNGVYSKEHSETEWNAFSTGLGNLNVTSVTASAGNFYAGTDGDGVYITEVASANWTTTAQTSIPHTTLMGLDGSKIQAMASYAGYVYASCQGGLLTTSDGGVTWEEAGNQFNLPSFTNVRKISFSTTRVFVSTGNNGSYANSLAELPMLPNMLSVSEESLEVPVEEGTNIITVTSNVQWMVSGDQSWLTVSQATGLFDGNFSILTAANTGVQRAGEITVSSDSLPQPITIMVVQDGTTGIAENRIDSEKVKIFPNPNKGNFTLDFSETGTVVNQLSIFDVTGRLLIQKKVDGPLRSWPVSVDYPVGEYYIRLDTNNGVVFKKVLIH